MPDFDNRIDRSETASRSYSISANRVDLVCRPTAVPGVPETSVLTLFAPGMGTDGLVNVRGSKGVRITSGPPPLPETESSSTDGIELLTGETGTVTLQRGLIPAVDQKMELAADGITIDAGASKVTIQSLSEITLSVAGGLAKIKLSPEGVTIEGLTIKVDAQVQAEVETLINKLQAQINQASSTLHMFS